MRGPNPNIQFKNLGAVTAGFGAKTREEAFHPGVDVANATGTPLPATVDAVVTKAEGGHVQGENNFGNTVEFQDAEGNTHQYHHLNDINVKPGQRIVKGQQVGTMGATGATYSPSGGDPSHLDYRITTAYGQYKNPMMYLKNL